MIPYLEGERVPSVPDGSGVLLGLRPSTCTRSHLARSVMEGASMGLKYGFERLRSLGIGADEIRLTGGGAKSRAWRQILADLFGVEVVCPDAEEGPAFGAALQACWATGSSNLQELAGEGIHLKEETRCVPQEENRGLYQELYELYSRFSAAMIESGIFPRHRSFIG